MGFFFGDILWNLILLGLLPPGSSLTSCSEDVNVELTVWAEELRVSSVSPLLRPFLLCLLHCYVNSSEIWSPKRHNPSGYTAGTSNDFIIFFPSLCYRRTAEGSCKAITVKNELGGSKNVGDRNIKVNKGEQKTRMQEVTWGLYSGRTVGNSTVSAASCLDYVL